MFCIKNWYWFVIPKNLQSFTLLFCSTDVYRPLLVVKVDKFLHQWNGFSLHRDFRPRMKLVCTQHTPLPGKTGWKSKRDAERDTHKKAIHKIEKALGEKEWFDLTILHLYITQQKGWRWRGHNLIIAERWLNSLIITGHEGDWLAEWQLFPINWKLKLFSRSR